MEQCTNTQHLGPANDAKSPTEMACGQPSTDREPSTKSASESAFPTLSDPGFVKLTASHLVSGSSLAVQVTRTAPSSTPGAVAVASAPVSITPATTTTTTTTTSQMAMQQPSSRSRSSKQWFESFPLILNGFKKQLTESFPKLALARCERCRREQKDQLSDFKCTEKTCSAVGKHLCANCFGLFHKTPHASKHTKEKTQFCPQCQLNRRTVVCGDCDLPFCVPCFEAIHDVRRRNNHRFFCAEGADATLLSKASWSLSFIDSVKETIKERKLRQAPASEASMVNHSSSVCPERTQQLDSSSTTTTATVAESQSAASSAASTAVASTAQQREPTKRSRDAVDRTGIEISNAGQDRTGINANGLQPVALASGITAEQSAHVTSSDSNHSIDRTERVGEKRKRPWSSENGKEPEVICIDSDDDEPEQADVEISDSCVDSILDNVTSFVRPTSSSASVTPIVTDTSNANYVQIQPPPQQQPLPQPTTSMYNQSTTVTVPTSSTNSNGNTAGFFSPQAWSSAMSTIQIQQQQQQVAVSAPNPPVVASTQLIQTWNRVAMAGDNSTAAMTTSAQLQTPLTVPAPASAGVGVSVSVSGNPLQDALFHQYDQANTAVFRLQQEVTSLSDRVLQMSYRDVEQARNLSAQFQKAQQVLQYTKTKRDVALIRLLMNSPRLLGKVRELRLDLLADIEQVQEAGHRKCLMLSREIAMASVQINQLKGKLDSSLQRILSCNMDHMIHAEMIQLNEQIQQQEKVILDRKQQRDNEVIRIVQYDNQIRAMLKQEVQRIRNARIMAVDLTSSNSGNSSPSSLTAAPATSNTMFVQQQQQQQQQQRLVAHASHQMNEQLLQTSSVASVMAPQSSVMIADRPSNPTLNAVNHDIVQSRNL